MSERVGAAAALLERAVDGVLGERPVDLPAELALARCSALIVARERLGAAALAAVSDVDRRELFVLDAAGSTRGWLRNQLGGDDGQLGQARRLVEFDEVFRAQAMGELSGRGAAQLCSALDRVPAQVPEETLEAVLVDGLQDLLGRQLGRGLPASLEPSESQLALRAELASVVGDALADDLSCPAVRLEPALLLLAREVAPGQLGWALKRLLDALVPDGMDQPDERDYYLDLVPVLDGDWDLRGHLDHETGTLLAAELARRQRKRHADAAALARATAEQARADGTADGTAGGTPVGESVDGSADGNAGGTASDEFADQIAPGESESWPADDVARPSRLVGVGQQRHEDFTQLLRDSADRDAGLGQPAPVAITIVASVDAVEARAGALPGMLATTRTPVGLTAGALQRSGCHSELTAVLVDALGRPVGASSTRRSADRRERAALTAVWGPFCAVRGCTSTVTVPHHVRPWWLAQQTVLKDLLPLCTHDHRDLHERHRTLELKDGRRIDEYGWAGDEA